MALNLKNSEADCLVNAIVELTGEAKTRAVIVALHERLDRLRKQRNQALLSVELIEIGKRCASYGLKNPTPHGDFLYDDLGLPK